MKPTLKELQAYLDANSNRLGVETLPLFNKRDEYIGAVEMRVVLGDDGQTPMLYCFDGEGNEYEQSAWTIARIINFSREDMPRTYAKEIK